MNQQDPLAQLRDIHLPDLPTWWPPAPGWWLLALLVLAALGLGLWLWRRHQRQQAYRRQAIYMLEQAWADLMAGGDPNHYAHTLSQILRRTALVAYPQHGVASLTGSNWLQFLDASSPDAIKGEFTADTGQKLARLPYQPVSEQLDLAPIHSLAMSWLSGHIKIKHNRGEESRAAV